jgi:NAD(P)H-flavin reductase
VSAGLGERPRTLAPLGRRLTRVTENRTVGAYRLLSALDSSGPSDPRPGQFYMLAAGSGWGAGRDERPYLPRAFSYARCRASEDGEGVELAFLLEDIGPGTERLARLEPGEGLWLAGPFGGGFRPAGDAEALLVGGGIGVAPLLALREGLREAGPVLLGFRSADHAAAAALFEGQVEVSTDDGSLGRHGLVTRLLEEHLDRGGSPVVRACGPPPMLEAVRRLCAERAVPAELALESGMACGFGACYGCVVPTREGFLRLCLDGPVLDASLLEDAAVAAEAAP